MNIKSLGNYSGIHPSLITAKGGGGGRVYVVKMIVEKINHIRHGGDIYVSVDTCDVTSDRHDVCKCGTIRDNYEYFISHDNSTVCW